MYHLQLISFGLVASVLGIAWGLLMALNPWRFWDLAKVDWNSDVVDARDHHKRHLVRIAGWIITAISASMLLILAIALFMTGFGES